MRDYNVARSLLSFLELLFWIGVLVGLLLAFSLVSTASRGYGAAPGLLAALPGLGIALFSLFGVASTQMGRAGVDSAEYGQQALKVARDQLEISKQAMKDSAAFQNSFAHLIKQEPVQTDAPQPVPKASQASYATTPATPAKGREVEGPVIAGDTLTYRGQVAKRIGEKWDLNGISFRSSKTLAEYIDTVGVQAKPGASPGDVK